MAAKLFHGMGHKQGKEGWMVVKAGTEKAYDQVEWSFLLQVLKFFDFSEKWLSWIDQCISTPTFSILLNGALYGNLSPS